MSARSLNKVMLIGNLTRDPELRYTSKGTAVCNFGLATNRYWVTDEGEKKEEAEFHRIVAWNKLAELCSQLLTKGRKVYVEGRFQSRDWTGSDGQKRTTTEIVISRMIILDSKRFSQEEADVEEAEKEIDISEEGGSKQSKKTKKSKRKQEEKNREKDKKKAEKKEKSDNHKKSTDENSEEVEPDDIPF